MDLPAHCAMSKRPASVTILLWLVFGLIVWNAIRLGASIANWRLLEDFAPWPGPAYIAGSGSTWILCGLVTWILLRQRNPRAHLATAAFTSAYVIWWWADRLFVQQQAQANWSFSLTLTGIVFILSIFFIFHRTTFAYFRQRERHERTITDTDTT